MNGYESKEGFRMCDSFLQDGHNNTDKEDRHPFMLSLTPNGNFKMFNLTSTFCSRTRVSKGFSRRAMFRAGTVVKDQTLWLTSTSDL